ncbi:MAG: glycosyltransferase family 1 protein [Pseudomonadota bacterium]|nr:glycosyltransferase family 1 protein [Pseudomonadota bacterium]
MDQEIKNKILKRQIRVLLNGLHSKSGGGLNYLRNILPLMAKDQSIDLHLVIHEDQLDQIPQNIKNVTIHSLKFARGFWRLLIHEQFDIPRLARTIVADVTFSPANYGPILAPNTIILIRNALSVAFVERRLIKIGYWIFVYLGTFISLLAAKKAIVVSEYALNETSNGFLGFFKNRFTVINHGVSEFFSPPKEGVDRKKFLLAVSDLYVQKNFKNLLLAFKELKVLHSNLTLKIAGNPIDNDHFKELKGIVLENKLENDVDFLGSVSSEKLLKLYQSCGIFVFASTIETFGNPLVEAMACGAPIACSNTAAMPEVVGDAAEFFDPRNVSSIVKVINFLLNDAQLQQRLSQKALKRAKAFSWRVTVEKTVTVLKKVESHKNKS